MKHTKRTHSTQGYSLLELVLVLAIVSVLACVALLIIAARREVVGGDNTTGHVWDVDLKELNNPLPRWWMGLFVITVVFAALYLAIYPGLGNAAGMLKWSSVGQYEGEQAKAGERWAVEELLTRILGKPQETDLIERMERLEEALEQHQKGKAR